MHKAWVAAAPILDGFLFRKLTPQGRLTEKSMSDKGVALVVKARAAAAGYDPALFFGHSLRAWFLTEAGRQGANLFKMKDHSRQTSIERSASMSATMKCCATMPATSSSILAATGGRRCMSKLDSVHNFEALSRRRSTKAFLGLPQNRVSTYTTKRKRRLNRLKKMSRNQARK